MYLEIECSSAVAAFGPLIPLLRKEKWGVLSQKEKKQKEPCDIYIGASMGEAVGRQGHLSGINISWELSQMGGKCPLGTGKVHISLWRK